jgi:hypothetical protein
MTALPSAVANNSTNSTLLLDLGALGTAAFALILSYCASLAFRRPWGLSVVGDAGAAERGDGVLAVRERPDRAPQLV